MNKRRFITVLAAIVCVGSVWAVVVQRQQLVSLRVEQQQRLQAASAPDDSPASAPTAPAATANDANAADQSNSSELLRLRSEITRLTARKRELAGAAQESERLRTQLAAMTANAGGNPLPQGYVRKTQARNAGYNTPEDTLQTFLWALNNHDLTNVLQTLTGSAAESFQNQIQRSGNSADSFFKGADLLPGLAIRNRQTNPDGSVQVEVEFAPGAIENFRFEPINGQWKLASPF